MIRAEDYPVPPLSPARQGRPPNATAPADAAKAKPTGEDQNVYVYREAEAEARADGGAQAGPAEPDESDAAFWYGRREETSPPAEAEYRGFFEPLVPSAAPSPGPAASDESAGRATQDAADRAGRADRPGPEEPVHAQARSLEQLKDFYLTAEAIGEENVDKHFDQLLAQQRELISEYFRQSTAKLGGAPASQPVGPVGPVGPAPGRKPPEPPDPIAGEPGRDRAAQVGPGEAVIAEKPRA